MARTFIVEVLEPNGSIVRYPMRSWLREHRKWVPLGQDPSTFNSHALRNHLKKQGWEHRTTEWEEILRSPEVIGRTSVEVFGDSEEAFVDSEERDSDGGATFAYESHLRDFLAGNLEILEPGLVLWGSDAVEYMVGTRYIDILARDREGIPVVIELKVKRGHEKTVGQSLYYRAKLKETMQLPRVRIIIVAAEISPELRLAASEISDLTLYEYALSMTVNRV